MTITVTQSNVHMGIIIVLTILQIRQQIQIQNLKKEVLSAWAHLGVLFTVLSGSNPQAQKDSIDNQNKN